MSPALGAAAGVLERWLPAGVLAAAALGVVLDGPARRTAGHEGIPLSLAVLVFTTGVSLAPATWRAARPALPRAALTVLVSTAVLPGLAWTVSRVVDDPELRLGVLTVGVAPAEVAAVALTGLAGGLAAISAVVLVVSVLVTVATAGPILGLLDASTAGDTTGLIVQLVLVVAAPLLAGAGLRAAAGTRPGLLEAARVAGVVALLALLWQVAGQAQLSAAYARVGSALVMFLLASAALGHLLAVGLAPPVRVALVLPVGMRDFAIAAGIATTASGPRAAAPLALYGVLVLVYGTVAARLTASARARPSA